MMAAADEVRFEHDGRVATITINRSEDQNGLTRDVLLRIQSHVNGFGEGFQGYG